MDSRINLLIAVSRLHDDVYRASCAQHARTHVAEAKAATPPRRTPRRWRRVTRSAA
jgi:hypothetical protein